MEHVAADVRRLKVKGLKARQIIAQGKRSETSAALGKSSKKFQSPERAKEVQCQINSYK